MPSYVGRHAEFYDLFYSEKDYNKEAEFINYLIQKYHKDDPDRLLEMACGTGNHAFLLEKYGYQIFATDYSGDMIEQARMKAREKKSGIRFEICDMLEVSDLTDSFDVVLCLFDSIGYVLTNKNIKTVFNGVFNRLNDDGVFILEFWHGAAMLKSFDPVRVKRLKLKDSEILRISETEVNYSAQTCKVSYSIYETKSDGSYNYIQETQQNRFFLLQEMRSFLESSNFEVLSNLSGYTEDETINQDTWHIVLVAKKGKIAK